MKRKWFEFLTCSMVWFILLSGFTTSLRTDLPSADDDPTETPTFIRATRSAFQERLDVDHYFTASAASTYDAADTGKHTKITFQSPVTISSVAADEGSLFTKDVSAIAELHWRDESENEKQLTTLGKLNIVSAELLGKLANDTYFTAVDEAGTGSVDLIKADANDVAVIPDNSQTATSAAPTSTTGIANKKYVDDTVLAFGARTTLDTDSATLVKNTVYLATCDGFFGVLGQNYSVYIQAGETSNPTNVVARQTYDSDNFGAHWSCMYPVTSGEYVRYQTPSDQGAWFKPIGTGGLDKQ